MFFSISKSAESNFPHHYAIGNLVVNTDDGWKKLESDSIIAIYKGYIDDRVLADTVAQIVANQSQYHGNYLVIVFNKVSKEVTIEHSVTRSSPIFYKEYETITNLPGLDQQIWYNNTFTATEDLKLSISKVKSINKLDNSELPASDVVNKVDEILTTKISNFLKHNSTPIKVFLSGGIDSMLVYSYIKKLTNNYSIVTNLHTELDEFWCNNSSVIQNNNWAYNQIHYWTTPTVLSSGAPGDEFMLRSPGTSNLFLMHHHTTIQELLALPKFQGAMNAHYFSRAKNLEIFNKHASDNTLKKLTANRDLLIYHLLNEMQNDYQHWHLGNTLTFTPLRDLEIGQLMFRLPINDAIGQILDNTISKELIERNDPTLLQYLSKYKNHNSFENMWPYFKQKG